MPCGSEGAAAAPPLRRRPKSYYQDRHLFALTRGRRTSRAPPRRRARRRRAGRGRHDPPPGPRRRGRSRSRGRGWRRDLHPLTGAPLPCSIHSWAPRARAGASAGCHREQPPMPPRGLWAPGSGWEGRERRESTMHKSTMAIAVSHRRGMTEARLRADEPRPPSPHGPVAPRWPSGAPRPGLCRPRLQEVRPLLDRPPAGYVRGLEAVRQYRWRHVHASIAVEFRRELHLLRDRVSAVALAF